MSTKYPPYNEQEVLILLTISKEILETHKQIINKSPFYDGYDEDWVNANLDLSNEITLFMKSLRGNNWKGVYKYIMGIDADPILEYIYYKRDELVEYFNPCDIKSLRWLFKRQAKKKVTQFFNKLGIPANWEIKDLQGQ